ncbi:pentatricopeptide repeat-containing protein At4g08210 [Carica papaya]|uniref:pentatricopeptide repeat-containing protein At4g08210 n=1 Tax=Carica papaya TaxID=3649 RepID=UPI000B8D1898|nr:pentatricopeptide repeat-containing protein At4g08210 [Carica papaya]
MLRSHLEVPNGFIYSAVLKACSLVGDTELGRLIHGRIYRYKLEEDVVLMNTLSDMYVKCGSLSLAKKAFGEILNANSTSWNTIIAGYCKAGLMVEAVHLFRRMPEPNIVSWNSIIAGFADSGSPQGLEFLCMMHRKGLRLDEFTLPCALKSCSYLGSLATGQQIQCYVLKSGFESSCFIASALVDMYSNCSVLNEAEKLFNQYMSTERTYDKVSLLNSMISGYVVNEENRAALNLVMQIYFSGLCIDSYAFSSILKICINLLNLRLGLQVHGLVVTSGFELDCVIGSILIDLYSKLGNVKDALALFHRLPEKDSVTWSGLIISCAKMGFNSLAFSLFTDMVKMDHNVDQFVISSILKVCSSLASLGSGRQVHAFCIKIGYESEGVIMTSMIDMYSKCGEIGDSLALFICTSERDIVCWTGIIMGCAQNGRAKDAIRFFYEMIQSGLEPNEVTFLGVLSACRHAGLVEDAWTIFRFMKYKNQLEPQLEHYYCMVDLLAQVGRFKEVEKLIDNMPFEPDKTIWSSMLAACAIHKNIKLVTVIAERLLVTSSRDHSVYVMLSNVYATLGMWDHLSKVREASKKMGIKEAGKSWIKI